MAHSDAAKAGTTASTDWTANPVRSEMGPGGVRRVPIDEVMRVFLGKPGFLLNRIDQVANALYTLLGSGGETLAQAELLMAIEAGAASDQVGIARACGIDTSTCAIILGNLEMTGLVERVQDQRDRRRSLPALTAAGLARMPLIHEAFAALQDELLAHLLRPEAEAVCALLRRIADADRGAAPRWDPACSPLANAPSMLFRRALQISNAQFSACIAPLTITLRQFSALVILHLHPELSQVDYARSYGLDPSTCAIVLKKLTARGLLTAVRCPDDRRKTLYATTADGAEQAATIQAIADRSEGLTFLPLSAGEKARLLVELQAIVHRLSPRLRYPGCLPPR